MTEPESPCGPLRRLLSLRTDGLLAGPDATAAEAHLRECADCRAAVAADAAVGDRLRERARGAASPGFALRVAAAVARDRAARIAQSRFLRQVAAAAVFVTAVATGTTLLRDRQAAPAPGPGPGPAVASARDAAAGAAFRAPGLPAPAHRRR